MKIFIFQNQYILLTFDSFVYWFWKMKIFIICIYKPDEFIQRCIVYGLEMKSLSDSQIIHNIDTV